MCSLTDLAEAAMDYWALGHIHKSQVLSEEPLVVYSGNPQGLHRKEIGPQGCYLVSVSHIMVIVTLVSLKQVQSVLKKSKLILRA